MDKPTVMIDLEGTLTDNSARVSQLLHDTNGTRASKYRDAWRAYNRGLCDDPLRSPAFLYLGGVIAQDLRVIIYTTRYPNKYNDQWLKKNQIQDPQVEFKCREPGSKGVSDKVVEEWFREIQPDVVVDDRPENRQAAVRAGVPLIYTEEFKRYVPK